MNEYEQLATNYRQARSAINMEVYIQTRERILACCGSENHEDIIDVLNTLIYHLKRDVKAHTIRLNEDQSQKLKRAFTRLPRDEDE